MTSFRSIEQARLEVFHKRKERDLEAKAVEVAGLISESESARAEVWVGQGTES